VLRFARDPTFSQVTPDQIVVQSKMTLPVLPLIMASKPFS
jgi:hypothetical protein